MKIQNKNNSVKKFSLILMLVFFASNNINFFNDVFLPESNTNHEIDFPNSNTSSIVVNGTIYESNHTYIEFNNNSDMINFFAGNESTMDGSPEKPYILENLCIGDNPYYCIIINNTNLHLIVRNCVFFNQMEEGNAGVIYLNDSTNISFLKNLLTECWISGLVFEYSSNILIDNNIIVGTSINCGQDSNFTISNNQISGYGDAISLSGYNHIIMNNKIQTDYKGSDRGGIRFFGSNITIMNNVISFAGSGIKCVWNSNNTIVNNKIFDCLEGIRIQDCENNTVINNNISDCENDGIYVRDSINNTISNNEIINCGNEAIDSIDSTNNTITENLISQCDSGIYLQDHTYSNNVSRNNISNTNYGIVMSGEGDGSPNNNTIFDNHISYSAIHGISLANIANNNNVSGNYLEQCNTGIFIIENSYHNVIESNHITNCFNDGISLNQFSFENSIYGNTIQYCEKGINIDENSVDNLFFLNNLLENTLNYEILNDASNIWDNGTHGNYWGDYHIRYPMATNNCTFWDTPYEIGENNVDHFPLANIHGVTQNTIPAISHLENYIYSLETTGHFIEWVINDFNVYSSYYSISRDGIEINNGSWISGSPISINIDGLDIGNYFFAIEASDGYGGINSDSGIIIVEEDIKPVALFEIITENITTNTSIEFSFTGVKGNLPVSYQWNFGDGTSNSTLQNPSHIFREAGNYTVTLTVTDRDGDVSVYRESILVSEESDSNKISSYPFTFFLFIGLISILKIKKKVNK